MGLSIVQNFGIVIIITIVICMISVVADFLILQIQRQERNKQEESVVLLADIKNHVFILTL